MIASPHFAQTRLVIWLTSSRFASEARAVFESSPFFGIDSRPLSPIFCQLELSCWFAYNPIAMPSGMCMLCWNEVYHREFLLSNVINTWEGRFIPTYSRNEFVFRNVLVTFLERSKHTLILRRKRKRYVGRTRKFCN